MRDTFFLQFIGLMMIFKLQAFKNLQEVKQLFTLKLPFQSIILTNSLLSDAAQNNPAILKTFPSCVKEWFMTERSTQPDHDLFVTLKPPLSVEDLMILIKEAMIILQNQNQWLQVSNTQQGIFTAFEKAIHFDEHAILHVVGDQHGSFHDTVHFLDSTFYGGNNSGLSPFKDLSFVLKPEYKNHHWIFCGDLTDGGLYGVETLALILSIFIKNPDNIHIIRGNHEDIQINHAYGFWSELEMKYGNNSVGNLEQNFLFLSLRSLLSSFYDQLPVALWGIFTEKISKIESSNDETKYDVFLFCHGGIEQQDYDIVTLCRNCIKSDRKISYKQVNGTFLGPTDIGYLWNDINPNVQETKTRLSGRGPNCYFLSLYDIAKYMKKEFGGSEFVLRHIFRAHQHTVAYAGLMPIFFQNEGICQLGDSKNPIITTLLVMPGTFAGIPLKSFKFPGVIEAVSVVLYQDESSGNIHYDFIGLPNDHVSDTAFQLHNAILKELGIVNKFDTKHQFPRIISRQIISRSLLY